MFGQRLWVNGVRGAIIDLKDTNPKGWENDRGPALAHNTDAVIYEMHHRDFSIHANSGVTNKGKFVAMLENGTLSLNGEKTGIDHLKELGITHVHILPSYDYNSVDETQIPSNKYNWGYDPLNYNVPEGSYASQLETTDAGVSTAVPFRNGLMLSAVAGLAQSLYPNVSL